MLKEIIISITDNFHDLGHGGSDVDHMIDSEVGRGHRMEWGHDLEGLINSYDMDGISGIGEWFAHMAKDFTTIDGIPLPFAEAIKNISGMDTTDAIDWLCINAADGIELVGEGAALYYFRDNPKAFKLSLVLGTLIGFADDNPLMLAANTVVFYKYLKKNNQSPYFLDKSVAYLSRCGSVIGKVAVGTAVVDIGAGFFGVDLAGEIGDAFDSLTAADGLEAATEWGETIADIIDGAAMLGIPILVSKGVKSLFDYINKDKWIRYQENMTTAYYIDSLEKSLAENKPAGVIAAPLTMLIEDREYQGYLPPGGK